jgi:hemoglobin/transferrin/lactoferrin receptor protein
LHTLLAMRLLPRFVAGLSLLAAGHLVVIPTTLAAQQVAPRAFDIPAQPLASALREFARQAGLELLGDSIPSTVRSERAIAGRLAPDLALQQLLRGSGVEAVIDGPLLIVRRRSEERAQPLRRVEIIARDEAVAIADRVERAQAREIRDVFAAEPSVSWSGGTRNGQRLFLRGVEGSNLAITVDGARQGQNLYNHRGGMQNVEPEILKRVDVQPGPAAADQGFGAMGGAIRFETIDAQDRLAPGQRAGGFARSGYASVNAGQRLSAGVYTAPVGPVGLLVHGSGTNYEDLRIGGGDRVPFSGGRDRAALVKLSVLDLAGHSLRVSAENNRATGLNFMQRGDYPYQLQPVDLRARPPQEQRLERTAHVARYRFTPGTRWLDVEASAARNHNEFDAPTSQGENFQSSVHTYDVRNTSTLITSRAILRTTVGADRFHDRGSYAREGRPSASNVNDNTGLFVQQRVVLSRLTLSTGVRHDRYEMQFGPSLSSGSVTSPNASAEVRAASWLEVHAGYGESARGFGTVPIQFAGFLAPEPTYNGSVGGSLRAERARQYEGGVRLRGESLLQQGDRLDLRVTAYRTRLRDAIHFLQPGTGGLGNRRITDFFNSPEEAILEGVDARLRYATARAGSSIGFTRAGARNLPELPQFIARAGAPVGPTFIWDSHVEATPRLTVGWTFTAVGQQPDLVPGQPPIFIPQAGYTVADAQLLWRPSRLRDLTVAVAGNNLFDRRFVSHTTLTQDGFATEEPGRNLRVTLGWGF